MESSSAQGAIATTVETRPSSEGSEAARSARDAPADTPKSTIRPVGAVAAAAAAASTAASSVAGVSSPSFKPGSSGATTRQPARPIPRTSLWTAGWLQPRRVPPLRKTMVPPASSARGRTSVTRTPPTIAVSTRGSSVNRVTSGVTSGMRAVAEGIPTTRSAFECARKLGIETPIIDQVYAVLHEGKLPAQAMQELLERDQKSERG